MKNRNSILVSSLALFVVSLAACGDPPQPIDTPKAAANPAPGAGQLPPGHPSTEPVAKDTAPEETLAGTIVLDGAKFDAPGATVFVSVRPKGQKAPWLSRKYPMNSPDISTNAEGARVLSFKLRSADPTGQVFNSAPGQNAAPAGIELELSALLKGGGFVDSPTLVEATAPFESGKSDYQLKLNAP